MRHLALLLLISCLATPVVAQQAVVTGTVLDHRLRPLAGATVEIPEVEATTRTGDDGRYGIVVPPSAPVDGRVTLRVSLRGFRTATVPLTLRPGEVRRDVTLVPVAIALDELVVTPAGSVRARVEGARTERIDGSAVLAGAPVADIAELLQARAPGLSVSGASGLPGSAARIRSRGIHSFLLSNRPVVYVDGILIEDELRGPLSLGGRAVSGLGNLDPYTITAVEVAGGPAAARYGSDASTGSIHLRTTAPAPDGTGYRQRVALRYGITGGYDPPSNWGRCSAADVAPDGPNPLCRGRSVGTVVSDNPLERTGVLDGGAATMLRWSGHGGDERLSHAASVGWYDETGVLPTSALDRRFAHAQVTWAPGEAWRVRTALDATRTTTQLPLSGMDAHASLGSALLGDPRTVGSAPDGWYGADAETLRRVENEVAADRWIPRVRVAHDPLPWFSHRLVAGADIDRVDSRQDLPEAEIGTPFFDGQVRPVSRTTIDVNSEHNVYTVDYRAYLRPLRDDSAGLAVALTLGARYTKREHREEGAEARYSLGSGAGPFPITEWTLRREPPTHDYSLVARLGYGDRAFLTAGANLQRTRTFEGHDHLVLPHLGLSYVISDEPFWRSLAPAVHSLRLRAAWGRSARSPHDKVSPFAFYSPVPFGGDPGELTAERAEELEFGLDAGLLNDRVGLGLTYFDHRATDLVLEVTYNDGGSLIERPDNAAGVRNRGVGMELIAHPIQRSSFAWDLRFGLSLLKSEITSLAYSTTVAASPFIAWPFPLRVGRSPGAIVSRRVLRTDTVNGLAIVSDTAEFLGHALPTREGSLATNVRYGSRLRVAALLDWRGGFKVWDRAQFYRDWYTQNSELRQRPERYSADEWLRRLGPYVRERDAPGGDPLGPTLVRGPYLRDGTFLRLRELSLAIRLPDTWAHRVGAAGAELTLAGRDLALWTRDDVDADVAVHPIDPVGYTDLFVRPPVLHVTAGLSVEF